jgi:Protein of unknown function (DUF3617)
MKTVLLVIICATTSALVAAESLNVKTGAWETTVQRKTEGNIIPPGVMAQMPPERRAAIEKSMAAQSGKTRTNTFKACQKKEDLERGKRVFDKDDEDDDSNKCKRKIIESTGKKVVSEITCTGENARTGKATIEAKSPELIVTTLDFQIAGGGKTHIDMSSKWLGASCAGIKD